MKRTLVLTASLFAVGGGWLLYAQDVQPFSTFVQGSYHHASTAQEGAARGMASVIGAAGAANMMNSQAAINIQEANKKYIENRLQATDTYFRMKSINQQYRESQRKPPPTQEQAIRISQMRLPDRATANNIDPLTGQIAWPKGLQFDAFKDARASLEQLFAIRAEQGHLSPDQFMEVRQLTTNMTEQLRNYTSQLGGNASIQARKFLDTLAYEAGFQAG